MAGAWKVPISWPPPVTDSHHHLGGSPLRRQPMQASPALVPAAPGRFGADGHPCPPDAGDTTGTSCPALPCWSTNMCLNQQKKVVSKPMGGFKSSFLHPVRHLLTFCIAYKLHSHPLYMRKCIFQPQSYWGLVESLFSLLDGRALSLLSKATFLFLFRVEECLWINNSRPAV